ncbi:MAG: TonB-dependent receptor [Candidatus Kapabacteria bacterium]|nr:TonB-dependent receptor [Ignavibacteriota bacterium]MCW5886184.1 TonB-dependent receptor [Candidatus Kapabacteria bacterium]
MRLFLLILMLIMILLLQFFTAKSETETIPSQNVKGNVLNQKNLQPVTGATIAILDTKLGTYSKKDGAFLIKDVPVGRHTLRISAVGFEPRIMNIVVTSGRETVINANIIESFVLMEEIIVTANKSSFVPINESVMISATEFTVDDAQRFAGSRMDPARMAQNYAGVLGANDSRNDIIIRGGAPTELLWRVDGLDIPNPNHFATQGATGGPVSAINTMILDNSDFLTGAFPVEYQDRMSGVFDLRTRSGNRDNYEYYGQFGFNGIELGAEGPLPGRKGSFLASYRYSFLGLLEVMGVDFGFAGIPKYQDASFKTDLSASQNHKISLTGLWGTSDINIKESETDDPATGENDIKNGTDFLALALNWNYLISEKVYINTLLGFNYANYRTALDSITVSQEGVVSSLDPWFTSRNSEGFYNLKSTLNYSPDKRNIFKFGLEGRFRFYDFSEERLTPSSDGSFYNLLSDGNTTQYMMFANWNHRFTSEFQINAGILTQYLSLSGKTTFEPRLSAAYKISEISTLNAGFGVHRQSLPLITAMSTESGDNLNFMQSLHYIAGYSVLLADDAFIKVEGYFKDISNAPVNANEATSFSFLNAGANFGSVFTSNALESAGLGKTYGAELSLIKNFTDGYYITATASYVRQEYRGSDRVWRSGAFDNQYIFNILGGYEWVISPTFTLEFAVRYTHAGGAPYTPIDVERSLRDNTTRYIDSEAFSLRNPDYSRFDLRIDFRHNLNNMSIISYFSVENLFVKQNVLMSVWDGSNQEVKQVYQLGFFPIGGVRIEF